MNKIEMIIELDVLVDELGEYGDLKLTREMVLDHLAKEFATMMKVAKEHPEDAGYLNLMVGGTPVGEVEGLDLIEQAVAEAAGQGEDEDYDYEVEVDGVVVAKVQHTTL
jgi:hypothetical protein